MQSHKIVLAWSTVHALRQHCACKRATHASVLVKLPVPDSRDSCTDDAAADVKSFSVLGETR